MAPYLTSSASSDSPIYWNHATPESASETFNDPPIVLDEENLDLDGVDGNDIAVIGFSIRFPEEATSAEGFWKLILEGRCTAKEFPPDRINHEAFYSSDPAAMGTIRPKKAHFIDGDLSAFDADFFGIGAAEAAAMDPQQRLVLETTYRALENAGLPIESVSNTKTSVHTGFFTTDFQAIMAKDVDLIPKYSATGLAASMLSNRVSNFFNLTGPSITLDTACSSSLVALDLGCQALRNGTSPMGIVAGCSLILGVDLTVGMSNMGFLSPDGVCHSFDSKANGYARGEGISVVIIKPVATAIRDGDTIRAVIRATRTNQDGQTGLAQPSKEAQKELIDDIYTSAKLQRSWTGYVEAHGTGTAIGDPLEASAIGSALGAYRSPDTLLPVGSVKANIGHLEGTAGIAGLIKSILVLENAIIPPIANLDQVNPEIDADFYNLEFPRKARPWPSKGLRRASINSFGFGGTNSHAVMDDAYHYLKARNLVANHCTTIEIPTEGKMHSGSVVSRASSPDGDSSGPLLLTWSAAESGVLTELTDSLAEYVGRDRDQTETEDQLGSLAYTLSVRRTLFPWRSSAVVHSMQDMKDLRRLASTPIKSSEALRLGFVFTGQGAQWCGMGRELLVYPKFRESLWEAVEYLRGLGCKLWLAGAITGESSLNLKIHEPRFSQPVCTILQVALIDLLASLGIMPTAVVGHSSGEIAAAYCAGALTRESAWKLAFYRGVYSQRLVTAPNVDGGMMSVGLFESDAQEYIDTLRDEHGYVDLVVACVNSPVNVTISGTKTHLEELQRIFDAADIFCRMLRVSVAYHGPHMLQVASEYRKSIGGMKAASRGIGKVRMISSVTGALISREDLGKPEYWVQNLVSTVRFSDAVQMVCQNHESAVHKKIDLSHLKSAQVNYLLELGPHSTLSGPIRDILRGVAEGVTYHHVLSRGVSAIDTLLAAAGKLHCHGGQVDLLGLNEPHGPSERKQTVLADLPAYPFNHSKSYWHESRLSRNTRLRPHPRNDFIGMTAADWNPLDRRWRVFLKPNDQTWMHDHRISGVLLYPAAGMLVMAIEAARQVAGSSPVVAFEINDANFHTALQLNGEGEGVEAQLTLRDISESSSKRENAAEYRLFAIQADEWVEICRGVIKTIFDTSSSKSNDSSSEIMHMQSAATASMTRFGHGDTYHQTLIDRNGLYEQLFNRGYDFGPSFQSVHEARYNGSGEIVGKVEILPTPSNDSPSIIHPTTLDGMLHSMLPVVTQMGSNGELSTAVPTRIDRLWIADSGLLPKDATYVDIWARVEKKSMTLCESSLFALSEEEGSLKIMVRGLQTTVVSKETQDLDLGVNSYARKLCWDFELKPDLTLMHNTDLQHLLQQSVVESSELDPYLYDCEMMLYVYVARCMEELTLRPVHPSQIHLQKQLRWLQDRLDCAPIAQQEIQKFLGDEQAFDELTTRINGYGKSQSELYQEVGANLSKLLSEQLDALEFLFESEALSSFYEETMADCDFIGPLKEYLELWSHKNSSSRMLEVGGGTGATTKIVLDYLSRASTDGTESQFAEYAFTDISSSFFEKGKATFGQYPKTRFAVLDIERDPADQGFECGSYDIVFAANVIHATSCLATTLGNVRKLLRPGGKLVLFEVTTPELIWIGFVFGFLPGWWLGVEPERVNSPCLTEDQWSDQLLQSGFSGADLVFHSHKDQTRLRRASMIVATAVNDVEASPETTGAEILHPKIDASTDLSDVRDFIQEQVSAFGVSNCHIITADDFLLGSGSAVETSLENIDLAIVVDSMEHPILPDCGEDSFSRVHRFLNTATSVLWISPHDPQTQSNPATGAVKGLARCIRSENPAVRFVSLSLAEDDWSHMWDDNQLLVLRQALSHLIQTDSVADIEPEMVGIEGVVHIPRVKPQLAMDLQVFEQTSNQVEKLVKFGDYDLRLSTRTRGLLDSLYFSEVPAPQTEMLADDEIEVQVKAFGVNFKDCLVALGRVDEDTFGTECSGIVLNTGAGCTLKKGDKVIVSKLDVFSRRVRCKEALAALMPKGMDFTEAAKLATNFVTAYHALVTVARLQAGETVLIHAAAGGTGQAALQICQYLGAQVFVTAGTEQKRELLQKVYGLPEHHIFHSRDTSFAQGVRNLTNNRGVDVVFNSLAGEGLVASWKCVAPYGRLLEIGKRDIISNSKLPMSQFARNVTFSAIDVGVMTTERPDLIKQALTAVVALVDQGCLKVASPLVTFPLTGIEDSFRYLQSGQNAGVVAIEVDPEVEVRAMVKPRGKAMFDPNATYVVSGGLGGQGKSIVKWMRARKAKNFLLLSRSGASSSDAQEFVAEMERTGATVSAPPCDISDQESLAEALKNAESVLPPIKGCIQAAMVLKDAMFETMSYDSWRTATRPKIQGTWNLHKTLPADLDFFILLSSISGIIGSAGQSNYVTGNAYQDELARHRVRLGQAAVSLNLPVMVDQGYVANQSDDLKEQLFNMKQILPMSQEELFALLDHFCCNTKLIDTSGQLILGLDFPASVLDRGLEEAYWMESPLFTHLRSVRNGGSAGSDNSNPAERSTALNIHTQVQSATSIAEASSIVVNGIVEKLAKVISTSAESIDSKQPIQAYGVDSLVAVELRNWFLKTARAEVAVFEILGSASIEALGTAVAERLLKQV